jgi:hypothetical protein
MMTRTSAIVRASDHGFGLFDRHEIPIETADWSTGLAIPMSIGAMIYTGIDRGPVHVTAEVLTAVPGEINPGPWDDIAEASLNAPYGELYVHQLEHRPGEVAVPLPLLTPHGPGNYRLRAHTQGRDRNLNQVQTEPSEHYLLTIWPADPLPPLIIRAPDRCGYGLRLAGLTTPKLPPPAEEQQHRRAEQQHRNNLRDAILEVTARHDEANRPTRKP